MPWVLVWTVLGVAALAVLVLLVRRVVRSLLALLRELTAASDQLAHLGAATDGVGARATSSAAPLPSALAGPGAAGTELRRWLHWPRPTPGVPAAARRPGEPRSAVTGRPQRP